MKGIQNDSILSFLLNQPFKKREHQKENFYLTNDSH